ncbi:MAG: RIP metalloprotease RseP [Desulfobacterota bacterium]|nr:RIP metalloprotease RseP [Thermodesulfobacteriota bacterium]MDW8001440.1 RIP metalloprotease RseP [Deltaproteobacteria bacterium]
MIESVVYGLVTLSILIFVHEVGHFVVARLAGIKVITFSIGFGKKLIRWKRGETEYAISLFPLGGYVKLLGESPDEPLKEDDIPRSYIHKRPIVKLFVAFSGPLANFIFAFLVFFTLLSTGYKVLSTKVGKVEKSYPAHEVGIEAGDRIVEIDGKKVEEWGELTAILAAKKEGESVNIKVMRKDSIKEFTVTPKVVEGKNIFGERVKRKVIGIVASDEYIMKREPILSAIEKGVTQTVNLTALTLMGIWKLIRGVISPSEIGGPLMIMDVAGKQAKEGKRNFLYFLGLISVNLAIINLLPIPVLDGGYIVLHLVEMVSRRRISTRWIEVSQRIGIGLLVGIMALAFFNDVMRFFRGK